MQTIPYNPATDPFQYYGPALGALFGGLEQQHQGGLMGGDIQAWQQYMRNQEAAQQAAAATGLGQIPNWPGAQPQPPQMRSQMGQQMMFQNMFGDPFGVQRTKAELQRAQTQASLNALPREKFTIATGLRKEFNADKAYKDFQTIQRSERSMKRAYDISVDPKTKSKVASDQALAVSFQKMLDPTSVVRESEYARTPEGIGFIQRIQAYIPQLRKGGLGITDDDRKALYDMSVKLLEESKITLNKHIDRYTQLAEDYGVEPRLIMGNIKRFDVDSTKPSQSEESPEIREMSIEELEKIASETPPTEAISEPTEAVVGRKEVTPAKPSPKVKEKIAPISGSVMGVKKSEVAEERPVKITNAQISPKIRQHFNSLTRWVKGQTQPTDLIADIKIAIEEANKGAYMPTVFGRILEKYKNRPELAGFLETTIKPLIEAK